MRCMTDHVMLWCGIFFFFKQKTAYDMRISDWSSDVCSSDLSDGYRRRHRLHRAGLPRRARDDGGVAAAHLRRLPALRPVWSLSAGPARPSSDRKSVVWGQSVSVRVEHGGRRIIKTKKSHNKHAQPTTITARQQHITMK